MSWPPGYEAMLAIVVVRVSMSLARLRYFVFWSALGGTADTDAGGIGRDAGGLAADSLR